MQVCSQLSPIQLPPVVVVGSAVVVVGSAVVVVGSAVVVVGSAVVVVGGGALVVVDGGTVVVVGGALVVVGGGGGPHGPCVSGDPGVQGVPAAGQPPQQPSAPGVTMLMQGCFTIQMSTGVEPGCPPGK